MKQILILITLLFVTISHSAKYKVGDCITPTNSNYSWYGKYARVTNVESGFDMFIGKSEMYYLNFINYDTRANKFVANIIDTETKKVSNYHCSD